jgi:hypothetical protein
MLMFRIPNEVYAHRMQTCYACKYYKPITKSCGTLLKGDIIEEEELQELLDAGEIMIEFPQGRKKFRTCGCVMPLKAKLYFSSCSVGKWKGMYHFGDRHKEFITFVRSLPDVGKVTNEQIDQMFEWMDQIVKVKHSRCPKCIKNIIQELKSHISYE